MEKITITQTDNTTLLTIGEDDNERNIVVNESKDYYAGIGSKKLIFPKDQVLTNLYIDAKKLSLDTQTALSLSDTSTIGEVVNAFITAGYFTGN